MVFLKDENMPLIDGNTSEWERFEKEENLSSDQLRMFQDYYKKLVAWNDVMNITTLETEKQVVNYHFRDSLSLRSVYDMSVVTGLIDVGSGGGFPGIPLKIIFPHIFTVLIEVNHKKRQFLQEVISEFGLTNIEVSSYDWRTFLRKTDYSANLFCARASLHTDELFRMFKPSCHYNNATLVYWASQHWTPQEEDALYLRKEYSYSVGFRKRRLIFFSAKQTD